MSVASKLNYFSKCLSMILVVFVLTPATDTVRYDIEPQVLTTVVMTRLGSDAIKLFFMLNSTKLVRSFTNNYSSRSLKKIVWL